MNIGSIVSPLVGMATNAAYGYASQYVNGAVQDLIDGNPEEMEALKRGFEYRIDVALIEYVKKNKGFSLSPSGSPLTNKEHDFFIWGHNQGYFTTTELEGLSVPIDGLGDNLNKRQLTATKLFGKSKNKKDIDDIERLNQWSISIGLLSQDEVDLMNKSIN